MRYGLLSDVHANLPALQAILRLFARENLSRLICAGDVVGYGPHPEQCIAELQRFNPVWVLGNHELMLLGRLPLHSAPPLARRTLEWTRSTLGEAAMRHLAQLPTTVELSDGIVVTHGSLRDVNSRVRQAEAIRDELSYMQEDHPRARFLILGNTHRPMIAPNTGSLRVGRKLSLPPEGVHIINPGSVGQSRGLSSHARAAILNTDASTVEFVSTKYEVSTLKSDLRELGFPPWTYHRSPLRRWGERLRRKAGSWLGQAAREPFWSRLTRRP